MYFRKHFKGFYLMGKNLTGLPVKAGITQGSMLDPLLFLFYINDLSDNLTSTVKLIADDPSLFSTVVNSHISAQELNEDLKKLLVGLIDENTV